MKRPRLLQLLMATGNKFLYLIEPYMVDIYREGGVSDFCPVVRGVGLGSGGLTHFSPWPWKFKHKEIQIRTRPVRISGSRVRYFSEPQRGAGASARSFNVGRTFFFPSPLDPP